MVLTGTDMTHPNIDMPATPRLTAPESPAHLISDLATASSAEQDRLILVEQVRLLYLNTPIAQIVTLLNASLLAAVQSTAMGYRPAILWLALMGMVAALRIAMHAAYHRTPQHTGNAPFWRNLFCIGAALGGAAWGSASLMLFPLDSFAHQIFLSFVLAGMTAGAIGIMASWFPAFALFSTLIALPTVIRFASAGDGMHQAMAWLTLMFLLAMLLVAHRVYRTVTETFRLRFRNKELIDYLTRAKEYTDALNRELLMAQHDLRKSNDALETRVAERTWDLSRANKELEKFAYVASHDLQEPLRTVSNFAQMLELRHAEKLDQDGREFIGYIQDGASHMRKLIDDLLAYSRLGTKALSMSTVDCESVFDETVKGLKTAMEESGAVIEHTTLPRIRGDAGQIGQLFSNLLSNAIKFRGTEPLHIHVSATRQDDDYLFSVRDNGIGIDPKYFSRIFEMYERLHSSSRYPGTGIGLALCKKIMENHHGRIWVESAEGHGTTFHFTLPFPAKQSE